jgi:hypothetical protein
MGQTLRRLSQPVQSTNYMQSKVNAFVFNKLPVTVTVTVTVTAAVTVTVTVTV